MESSGITGAGNEQTIPNIDPIAAGVAHGRCAGCAACNSGAGGAAWHAIEGSTRDDTVDTREQNPFDFSRFEGWFAGVEKKALKLGDYSVAGLEDRCVVERKALPDLVHSLTLERPIFINRLNGYATTHIACWSSRQH